MIIWKLDELGISSYAFEFLLNTQDKQIVNIWLPNKNWDKNSRDDLEQKISEFLEIRGSEKIIFDWSVIAEEDWLISWKKYWGPELVGNHIVILPCWLSLNGKYNDRKIIKIDPGAAFGTGSHPSTCLCLEKMEKIILPGKKVLDIGSGSGILSVTAKSFGASEICAIDNDCLAINSTKSNFQLNFGDLNDLNTYLGTFSEVVKKYSFNNFDYILCNILAEVIKEIIPDISKCLKNDGEVIFSGILDTQKDEIIKILNLNHLKLIDLSFKKDWVCIAAQKASNLTYT